MSGLSDRVLSNEELRALQRRSNMRGAMRLGIHIVLLVGAGWLVAVSSGWARIAGNIPAGIGAGGAVCARA